MTKLGNGSNQSGFDSWRASLSRDTRPTAQAPFSNKRVPSSVYLPVCECESKLSNSSLKLTSYSCPLALHSTRRTPL